MIFRCKPQSDVLLFFVVSVFQVKEENKTCEVNPQSDVFAVCFYLCMLLAGEVATAACVGCCFWGFGGYIFLQGFH